MFRRLVVINYFLVSSCWKWSCAWKEAIHLDETDKAPGISKFAQLYIIYDIVMYKNAEMI